MQLINSEIRAFIQKQPTEAALTDYVNTFVPQLKPTLKFHQLDLKSIHEPTLVYAHLAVQDIRDSYFFYSFIMKRPFKPDDKFMVYRWGNQPEQASEDFIQSHQYLKVMLERDPVICTAIPGLTQWAKKLEGHPEQIELLVDGKNDFKLGQVINVVAFYYPDHNKLYFVRRATPEEEEENNLNPLRALGKAEIDFPAVRQELLSFFSEYCSESMAEYLLMCLISEEPLFLGGQANITPLIEAVYSKVVHLKLVHPLEQSLFPYKNQEGEMMSAPLQLSNEPTFVSIDLSAFSDQNTIKIGEKAIDNFKALKVFVEENKTIYRWEYGQSLLSHRHRGIVVKAASFLVPHFHPQDQSISPDFSNLSKVPEETLQKYRQYIISVQTIKPLLPQEQRSKIQTVFKGQSDKQKLGQQLAKIMQLSKLLAMSHGRSEILMADFQRARWLVNHQVPPKQNQ